MAIARGRLWVLLSASNGLVLSLMLGNAAAQIAAAAPTTGRTPAVSDATESSAGKDCSSLGNLTEREACFAQQPDEDTAECERQRMHACRPYKEMHELEQQRVKLVQDTLAIYRKRYASYVDSDATYLDDLAAYVTASDGAWAAYRDADCLMEPFVQGMSRQLAPDLTEACRVERTKERIGTLRELAAHDARSP